MNLTEKFAKFIVNTDFSQLPDQAVDTAKERLLDTISAMIAGCTGWTYRQALLRAVKPLGSGHLSPIGPQAEKAFPAARVAMLNAAFAHALELDDGHKNAGVHAGAVVIPSALALGQELNKSGEDVLTAIILGYELVYRLAAAQSPELIDHGFHPSSVCGVIGAMVVAGKLLGLNETQMTSGLGMAALQAAGLMEATISGQQAKCIMLGNAAFMGISCAYIAKEDIEGCATAFEGKTGLFHAMSKELSAQQVTEGLGQRYLISETYSKFYPTCRHSQPAIEAALNMVANGLTDSEQVERVEVGTYQLAYNLTGQIKEPRNPSEAKFSIAYGVAAALIDHNVSVFHLQESAYTNNKYLSLAGRVQVSVDSAVNGLYPKKRGAKVKIIMKDGGTFCQECYDLKGSPQNPVDLSQLIAKFKTVANSLPDPDAAQLLLERCQHFEAERDLNGFMSLLNW